MSKRHQSAQSDMALSPYLSFRQALRPAIFAYNITFREKDRVGELANQANEILSVTRDLFSKAGLGYIAIQELGAPVGETGGLGSQTSLLDAFADAAILWAKIVGACLMLAESLLDQGRLDELRSLATALNDAGEAGAAGDLRERLANETMARYKARLGTINASMKPQEIDNAMEALTSALAEVPESPDRDTWLNSFLPALAKSVLKHIKEDTPQYYAVEEIAEGQRMYEPDSVGTSIADIAAALRARAIRRQ